MSDPTENQHRRDARFRLALQVSFRAGKAFVRTGTTTDFAVNGAFIQCESPPEAGQRVTLEVHSPTAWDPLVIVCDVRWRTEPGAPRSGFGVQFTDLTVESQQELRIFLSRMSFEESA